VREKVGEAGENPRGGRTEGGPGKVLKRAQFIPYIPQQGGMTTRKVISHPRGVRSLMAKKHKGWMDKFRFPISRNGANKKGESIGGGGRKLCSTRKKGRRKL